MRLPQVAASVLLARQTSLIPSDYCTPACPSCYTDVSNFEISTSCSANSSFIQNCGSCQTCVMSYAITHGGINSSDQVNALLVNVLNECENTTVSSEIMALQSQASMLSVLGSEIAPFKTTSQDPSLASMVLTVMLPSATTASQTATSSHPSWATGTGKTGTAWQSILSTATWAASYCAHESSESGSPAAICTSIASAAEAAEAKATASTTAPAKSTQTGAPAPLNSTWIAGPVVGSVLGMSTVFIVILFTRRKQKRDLEVVMMNQPPKEFHDDRDNDSNSNHTESPNPQVQAEIIPPQEVESREVYELPAVEPVGSELNTPMEARTRMRDEDWPVSPLPLSPLPLLFAMSEMRDGRAGNESPKHNTYYNP